MDLHEDLKILGWRQGSVLSESDFTSLLAGFTAGQPYPLGIVLSHSCDLLNPDLNKFPKVEIIIGNIIPSPVGSYQKRRNPRILHLPIMVGRDEVWVELRVENRTFVNREKLRVHSPDPDRRLLDANRWEMALWISGSYYRSALPDAFQECIRPNVKRLEKIFRELNPYISDVLIDIYPKGDIQIGQIYSATVTIIVENETDVNAEQILNNRTKLKQVLEDSSIDAIVFIKAESQASIKLLKSCYNLAPDYLSNIAGGDPLPALAKISNKPIAD